MTGFRTLFRGAVVASIFSCWLLSSFAQDGMVEPQYWNDHTLYLWVDVEKRGTTDVSDIYLWVTRDNGATWKREDAELGEHDGRKFLKFTVADDGEYGFRTQAIKEISWKQSPPQAGDLPLERVVVDTDGPKIEFTSRKGEPGEPIQIEWTVTDANLNAVRLEKQIDGGNWAEFKTGIPPVGSEILELPMTGEPGYRVRLVAEDKAGTGSNSSPVTVGAISQQDTTQNHNVEPAGQSSSAPTIARNRKFEIHYKVSGMDASGLKEVRLWYTKDDGQSWMLYGTHGAPEEFPFVFNAPADGVFGFWMSAISNAGIRTQRDPKSGDAPEFETLIDTLPPVIALMEPSIQDPWPVDSTQRIRWSVEEPLVGGVSIFYQTANKADANPDEWTQITTVTDGENYFMWKIPDLSAPYVRVRLQARDRAGNVGLSPASPWMIVVNGTPGNHTITGVKRHDPAGQSSGVVDVEQNGSTGTSEPVRQKPNPRMAGQHYRRGQFHRSQRQFDAAARHYRLALQEQPGHLEAMNELGWVYGEMRSVEAALETYARAREIAPGDSRLYYNPALILHKAERDAEALLLLENGVEMRPDAEDSGDMASLLYDLAESFRRSENEVFAERAVNSILKLDALRPEDRTRAQRWVGRK